MSDPPLAGGNYYRWLWPFANLGVAVLIIVVIQALRGRKEKLNLVKRSLAFIGIVSMYIFGLQGFLRNPFLGLAGSTETEFLKLISGLLFPGTATGLFTGPIPSPAAILLWKFIISR